MIIKMIIKMMTKKQRWLLDSRCELDREQPLPFFLDGILDLGLFILQGLQFTLHTPRCCCAFSIPHFHSRSDSLYPLGTLWLGIDLADGASVDASILFCLCKRKQPQGNSWSSPTSIQGGTPCVGITLLAAVQWIV